MSKFSDKALGYLATTAEDAFWEAMGLASKGGIYEPKMSEEIKHIKASHTSKVEKLFDKICTGFGK